VSKVRHLPRADPRRLGAGLAGVIVVLGAIAAPAAAVPLPPLKPLVIKAAPARPIDLPRPTGADLERLASPSRYGTHDAITISSLDHAKAQTMRAFDAIAERAAANTKARARLKKCVAEGLRAAGESFAEDVKQAVKKGREAPSPDFNEMSAATAGCLEQYFPNARPELIQTGKTLADHAAERATETQTATSSPAVLAKWLTAAGTDQSSSGRADLDDRPGTPHPPDDDGSPFPWWTLVVGLPLVGGGIAIARASYKT
jgi:hypothetical protein